MKPFEVLTFLWLERFIVDRKDCPAAHMCATCLHLCSFSGSVRKEAPKRTLLILSVHLLQFYNRRLSPRIISLFISAVHISQILVLQCQKQSSGFPTWMRDTISRLVML